MTEYLFVIAFVLLAYAYVGYPAVIWLLTHLFVRRVNRAPYQPHVTIVIVVYNEAERIAQKLESCAALDYPKERLRILVVSDGSDDGTNEIVRGFVDRRVSLLAFPAGRGKAACLNDAIARCEDEIIVLTDARQRLDFQAVRCLVENFADPAVGAASAELVFDTDGMTHFGEGMDAYWRYEKFIRRQESRLHSTVGVTGALYALRRECFRAIPADTILDDVVIPMNVVTAGRRVVFDNRAKAYDLPSADPRQEKRRKVRTLAGNYQLLWMHPRFLVPFYNPLFFQLVSHKALRLAAPWFMVALLITNGMLAAKGPMYSLLFSAQLLAYGLAVMGLLWPSVGRLRPVKLATTFLVLNWFAVPGLIEFLRNRDAHLWRSALAPSERRLTGRER